MNLPEDLAERIQAKQISDADLVQALRRVVEQKSFNGRTSSPVEAAGAQRAAAFRVWVASHTDVTAVVQDDSRETMYQDERLI